MQRVADGDNHNDDVGSLPPTKAVSTLSVCTCIDSIVYLLSDTTIGSSCYRLIIICGLSPVLIVRVVAVVMDPQCLKRIDNILVNLIINSPHSV